jgi:hypothetical protein
MLYNVAYKSTRLLDETTLLLLSSTPACSLPAILLALFFLTLYDVTFAGGAASAEVVNAVGGRE